MFNIGDIVRKVKEEKAWTYKVVGVHKGHQNWVCIAFMGDIPHSYKAEELELVTAVSTETVLAWNGGESPVHPETKVKVWMEGLEPEEGLAKEFQWLIQEGNEFSIVAYRVLEVYKPPRERFLAENKDGDVVMTFVKKENALKYARVRPDITIVTYKEVRE